MHRNSQLSLRNLAAIITMLGLSCAVVAGCGAPAAQVPTARQVLDRAVENLVALDSYRYVGSSRLEIEGMPELTNVAKFDTTLAQNGTGALDGHMVVTASGGGSYETYTVQGVEYTKLEGGNWYRVDRGGSGSGAGMVSADARKIITAFGGLVDEIRLTEVTPDNYVVSMKMGERYANGANAIVNPGGAASSHVGLDASSGKDTTMSLTVDRETFRLKRVVMSDTSEGVSGVGPVTIITDGEYSAQNEPVDITPPPEALNSPFVDPGEAAPTQQYQ